MVRIHGRARLLPGSLLLGSLLLVAAAALPAASPKRMPGTRTASPAAPAAVNTLARLPLAFEENRGQTDRRVRFLSRGRGYTLFLTGTEAVLAMGAPRGKDDPAATPGIEIPV